MAETTLVEEKILSLLKETEIGKDKNDRWVILGSLTQKEISIIKDKLGLDLTGYSRMIDISAVRHIRDRHPSITDTDFCLIPLILSTYDTIEKGDNDESIIYTKEFEKKYFYIEYIRKGRKRLALKTFYKTKKPQQG